MISITQRDDEILDALTLRVRLLSLDQVTRTWWSGMTYGKKAALRRLRQLGDAGKLLVFDLPAHPEIHLAQPVCRWKPRQPAPAFDSVSYKLSSRWTEPPIRHRAVIASKATGRHYGGWGGRFPRGTERTHDLHMATVFLVKLKCRDFSTPNWLSEEKIRERRARKRSGKLGHLPDAVIARPKRLAVEFGGAYSPDKLRSFHAYCEEVGLPYEIW